MMAAEGEETEAKEKVNDVWEAAEKIDSLPAAGGKAKRKGK